MWKLSFKKFFAAIAALSLALCLFSGCGAQTVPGGSAAPTAEQTAVPTGEPAYTPDEAVSPLQSVIPGSGAYLAPIDATHIVASWIEYEAGTTVVTVVDIENDTVDRRADIEGIFYMDPCLYDDGRVVLRDPDLCGITVLDSSLEISDVFDVPWSGGELSGDCSECYYAKNGALMRYDTASGVSSVIPTELYVSSTYDIDPASGLLTVAFNIDVYGTSTCTGVIDTGTGELVALKALTGILELKGSKWTYSYYDLDSYREILVYGTGDDTASRMDFDAFTGMSCSLYWVPGSDYAFCMQSERSDYESDGESSYWFYGLGSDEVRGADLAQYGITAISFSSAYLDGSGLIAASIFDFASSDYRLFIIDPDQVEYSTVEAPETLSGLAAVDSAIISAYEDELSGFPIDPALSEIRARADELEARYGVKLLISDECRVAAQYGDFEELLTGEDPFINELADLPLALDRIEEALALYPEGLLAQFQSDDGRGGICIMLVGSITSTYSVAGFQFDSGSWRCIELDTTYRDSFVSMLCHELMHAIESKITGDAPEADLYNAWTDCNPSGVDYYYSYTSGILDYSHTYSEGGARGDDIYFCDGYSKTFPTEDRARLMEYVMAYPYSAEDILESSVMYAKYEVLCRSIRLAFDTEGWTDVWWERYLKA